MQYGYKWQVSIWKYLKSVGKGWINQMAYGALATNPEEKNYILVSNDIKGNTVYIHRPLLCIQGKMEMFCHQYDMDSGSNPESG